MRRYQLVIMMILFSFLLNSCATTRNPIRFSSYTNENWKQFIFSEPKLWVSQADSWFLRGTPNDTELENRRAPREEGISTSMVNVGHFDRIVVSGGFQVQIFGSDSESAYVFGPNTGAHTVSIETVGNTLYVRQIGPVRPDIIHKVIVRIGVKHLTSLEQMGSGSIEAVQIYSNNLCITSTGIGNIYLSGHVKLKRLVHSGGGCINIFGVDSCHLEIFFSGMGSINLLGRVGVRSIVHKGSGDINIIGAKSDGLSVVTEGTGKIGLCGYSINLCSLVAKGNTCVYIYNIVSRCLAVSLTGNAQVGLAGRARELSVNACGCSVFWGRDLCTCNAFVRGNDAAHINFTAGERAFATAVKNSSIFFFGPANILAQNLSGNGVILTSEERISCNRNVEYRPYAYTLSPQTETLDFPVQRVTNSNCQPQCQRASNSACRPQCQFVGAG